MFTVYVKNKNKVCQFCVDSEQDLGRCLLRNNGKQVKVCYDSGGVSMSPQMMQRIANAAKKAA